ncbi:MAG: hypothetical protein JWO59_747 [Chloroflexi bacterium]|nr:hypothetical protein [Chloroflexota bacterium]
MDERNTVTAVAPHSKQLRVLFFVVLVLTAVCGAIFLVAGGRGTQGAAPAAPQVRVCRGPHYVQSAVSCSVPEKTISAADWPDARLSFTSKGDAFSSTALHITVSQVRADGSSVTLGTVDRNDMTLSDAAAAVHLSYVFATAGASPEKGQSYSIEVDNGGVLLGSVILIYTG